MILNIFTVRDAAAEAFLPPFYARTKGEAIRSFGDAALDKGRFGTHSEHYDLFHLGTFDDENGKIAGHEPIHVISALEAISVEHR